MLGLAWGLNHLLAQDPALRKQLAGEAGAVFRLVLPLGGQTLVVGEDGQLAVSGASPQATLTLPPGFFLQSLNDPVAARRAVELAGDVQLAARLGTVLAGLRWDLAESLAPWLGDIAAERLAGVAQHAMRWPQDIVRCFARQWVSYLRDEAGMLVTRVDVRTWCDDVDTFRDDLARLDARLRQLERLSS